MTTLEQDLGFEPFVEETVTPTQEPSPQEVVQETNQEPVVTDDVLSLNDEVNHAEPEPTPTEPLEPSVVVDELAILNKFFGTSDAESIKTKLARVAELEEENGKPRYQSKFAEIVDQLVSKYGDPKSQADVFKKTIDIITTDVDTLDEKTAVAFQMKQQYPGLDDAEIQTLLAGKYNLNDYATEEQQKLGAIQLKIDAVNAKLGIKELQANALKDVPNKQAALKQIDEQKRVLEWEQKSNEVVNGINSFEFEIEKGKKLKFDVPQAEKAMLAETAKAIASGSTIAPDANGIKQVEELVKMTYLYKNIGKIVSNAFKKGLSESNSSWAKKVHNPSSAKNTAGGTSFETQTKGENEFDENDILAWLSKR